MKETEAEEEEGKKVYEIAKAALETIHPRRVMYPLWCVHAWLWTTENRGVARNFT